MFQTMPTAAVVFECKGREQIDTVVQPDLCVFCSREHLRRRRAFGPPDWIIEILSPSTAKKDKNDKYELYQFAGVKEYWIVDPMSKTLMINSLNEEEQYINLGPFNTTPIVQPVLFPQLDIDLKEIFPDVDYVEEDWSDNYIRL